MAIAAPQQPPSLPLSGKSITSPSDRSPIRVRRSQNPQGEGGFQFEEEHTISISLASRPIHYLQSQDGKTHTGLFKEGDCTITPAGIPLFARWDGDEDYLQIRLKTQFVRDVASELFDQEGDQLELVPGIQVRDPHLAAIGTMLTTELHHDSAAGHLYLDSLANVLAINLLKQHTTRKIQLPIYEGGLPPKQLCQVIDYIDEHLEQTISLADLASLLNISQFHFSHLFKQSLGISPYHYLIQQRVERAKQLLRGSEQLIVDIAMACGFSSHSHFSKQFRQVTGMTPKQYRIRLG